MYELVLGGIFFLGRPPLSLRAAKFMGTEDTLRQSMCRPPTAIVGSSVPMSLVSLAHFVADLVKALTGLRLCTFRVIRNKGGLYSQFTKRHIDQFSLYFKFSCKKR